MRFEWNGEKSRKFGSFLVKPRGRGRRIEISTKGAPAGRPIAPAIYRSRYRDQQWHPSTSSSAVRDGWVAINKPRHHQRPARYNIYIPLLQHFRPNGFKWRNPNLLNSTKLNNSRSTANPIGQRLPKQSIFKSTLWLFLRLQSIHKTHKKTTQVKLQQWTIIKYYLVIHFESTWTQEIDS